jgi:hypothetical protein
MDFTPGGFLNRTQAEFRLTHPTQDKSANPTF